MCLLLPSAMGYFRVFSVFGRFRFLGFRVFVSVCDTCAYAL